MNKTEFIKNYFDLSIETLESIADDLVPINLEPGEKLCDFDHYYHCRGHADACASDTEQPGRNKWTRFNLPNCLYAPRVVGHLGCSSREVVLRVLP